MTNPKTQRNSNGHGLVLFPLPFHGHMTPMLHLANALHSKGFSITIIHTKFRPPNVERYREFRFRSIDERMEDLGFSDQNLMGVFNHLGETCLEPFRNSLYEVLNDGGSSPIACLISDPMWLFAGPVAEGFNLRNLVLRTGSLSISCIYSSMELIKEKGYYSTKDNSRLGSPQDTPVEEFPPLKVKDLPLLHGDIKQEHLDHFSNYARTFRNSNGFICNSFDELEPSALDRLSKDLTIPIFLVGPLHRYSTSHAITSSSIEEEHASISWLDTQAPRSVLYVCYGSTASISESDFLELAWGLVQSREPFLWAVRPGLVRNSNWVEPLPEELLQEVSKTGLIVKWAPQQQVLGHPSIKGFLTHCGWNSIVESVSCGVPLICLPCFADQMVNARYACEDWRVGILMESGPKREEIATAIKRLSMEEKEGEEIRQRMRSLMEKANLSLEEGGSSHKALEKLTSSILSFRVSDRSVIEA